MANYVTINTGSTLGIAAESIGSILIQQIKILDSTAGSTAGTGVIGNPLVISGSTTIIGTVSTTVGQLTSSSSLTIFATTAGTTILIPSTATNSIYITDLIVSNGATGGWVYLGETLGTTAPTTTAIKIQNIYLSAGGGIAMPFSNPIKLTASRNLTITAVTCTTLSATATYYVGA